MEFKIENVEVFGLNKSLIASGNPMRTKMKNNLEEGFDENDMKRARVLGNAIAGSGHDNFLKGIIVQMDIYAPLYMWKQIQRYHWFEIVSSQSTMHRLVKFKVAEQCTKDVDKEILNRYQELLDKYNEMEDGSAAKKELWRTLVASLPSGFILGATVTTNYLQLKTMCAQRRGHKLTEWKEFIETCEKMPFFKELTASKNKENGAN